MKGLILKDFYLIIKYCKAFLCIVIVFSLGSVFGDESNWYFTTFPCIITGMLPMTLYSYDERARWCAYSMTMPVSRRQFVSAKYAVGLLSGIAAVAVTCIAQGYRVMTAGITPDEFTGILYVDLALCLISPAIIMPFIFKLGAEKGRMAYYIVLGILVSGSAAFSEMQKYSVSAGNGTNIALVLAAGLIYVVSWLLSVHFYKGREL